MIDFHTHAFPEKIAQGALEKLSEEGGALQTYTDGTLNGVLKALDEIEEGAKGVVLPIATKPTQQASINRWAAERRTDRLEIFGSVYPGAPDALEQLEQICAYGLKGVKLHPEYQNFFVDEERMVPIYKKAAKLGLITVFHAGYDIGFPPPCHCTPEALRRMLPHFDGAPVVAAHFGGYMAWERVLDALCGLPLYLDTSYSYGRVIKPLAEQIVEKHGTDRVLFGSDLPWSRISDELGLVRSMKLSAGELHNILYENSARLLGWV